MDNAEQILKAQLAELLWQNAILTAEYNKLKNSLQKQTQVDDEQNNTEQRSES